MCSVTYLFAPALRSSSSLFFISTWVLNGDALKQSPDRSYQRFTGDTANMGSFPQIMVKS